MKNLYTLKQRNTLILGLTLLLGGLLIYALSGLFPAFLGAVVLYTIFRPLNIYLRERKKLHRNLATFIVLFSSLVAFVLPIICLILMLVNKVNDFQENTAQLNGLMAYINQFASRYLNNTNFLNELFTKTQGYLLALVSDALSGAFNALLQLAIMYFLLFFMFSDYQKIEKRLVDLLPFDNANTLKFAEELKNATYSNVLGQGFICLVQGSLLSITFAVFGVNDAIFWGIVTVFLSFLPLVGAPIVFVPAALISYLNGDTVATVGILLVGFGLIVNIDNVIRYVIAKKLSDTHPLISIIGIIIGIPLFGILGLVFGPLLFSFFILLVRIYVHNKKELMSSEFNLEEEN